ncbi:hypothetical protein AK812_SmicGene7052 [Symbiodinium microadriaticum]|uniref:Uncharacterized protein n=1 Tax=Symbiodinium microadriaticum TaxID=2951 RepID=A0A1Q9EPJ8_SYMMI|nr:hypothetical protein AK812_SmicGene7052 [Symbiodinium microadriaticum]
MGVTTGSPCKLPPKDMTNQLSYHGYSRSNEIALLDTWAKSSQPDLEAEVAKLAKQSEGTLKADAREKVTFTLKMLKQILRAKKKGEEL